MGWKITCRKQGEVGGEYRLPGADDPEILLNREGEETWRLCVTNRTQAPWAGVIRVEYHFPKTDPRFFMPAFLYGRNKGEWAANIRWYYPRLREGECRLPYAPWWMVRSDRLSHPSVFVFDGGRIRGLSASPYFLAEKENLYPWKPGEKGSFYQYAGFGCSLEEGFLAYTIGYENAPFFFLNSDTVQEREALGDNCFVLQPGQTLSVLIRVYDCEAQEANALGTALEEVYWQYHEEPVKKNGRRRTVEDLSEAISRDAWRPEGKNYATQVYLKDDGSLYFNEWFSISWTGGAEVAVPMLMAGLRLGREDIREQAAECVENIVEHSLNSASGLPYDACEDGVWSTEGWWKDHLHARGHSSYLVGQAVYYILKGYEWEKRLGGRVHTNWLEFAGGYTEWDAYQAKLNESAPPVPKTSETDKPAPKARVRQKRVKLTYKEAKELEALPAEIESMEAELNRLVGLMSTPDYHSREPAQLRADAERCQALQSTIEAGYARWSELEKKSTQASLGVD